MPKTRRGARPLAAQIVGSSKALVDYDPDDVMDTYLPAKLEHPEKILP